MTGPCDRRVRQLNQQPVNPHGEFVLYWMTSNRRLSFNFSLDRALEWCRRLNRPIVILEALRVGYPWANARLHRFVLEGMIENQRVATDLGVILLSYVEPHAGAGQGLLTKLASRSCLVVTDDYPCFFLPKMHAAVAGKVGVLVESVDSNGMIPMRLADREFTTAVSFRRFLQKELRPFLEQRPLSQPLLQHTFPGPDIETLRRSLAGIQQEWPMMKVQTAEQLEELLRSLPIDQSVMRGFQTGGSSAAAGQLTGFVHHRLTSYGTGRNHPDDDQSSGLSAYLHFGHISVHQVFDEVVSQEDWEIDQIGAAGETRGSRNGWWGLSEPAEAFLDELITWRELGFNMCCQRQDYDQYSSLPPWAQKTLADHAGDLRPFIYSADTFRAAGTHDVVWNAAQTQLLREGRIHNYLRMLWGKKILEWSASPQEALSIMIELNNTYAVDGRDPNSWSGIFWVLGRYDRAWGPERPILGKIRYMSSENTLRKLRMSEYLERFASPNQTSPKGAQGSE